MITSICLENFKIYNKRTCISGLKKINLLTGINGRGKSTTLQPLLLLKQTLMKLDKPRQLILNGDLVRLGNWSDVKNIERSNREKMSFVFSVDGVDISYELNEQADNNQVIEIASERIENTQHDCITSSFLDSFAYVSADRIGPRLSYSANPDISWIGAKGEYAVQILAKRGYDEIDDDFIDSVQSIYPNDDFSTIGTVKGMAEYWLSKMFGGTSLDINYVEDANIYTLKMKTNRGNFKATNIGFGYSYVLPIIAAGLTSPHGTILIVENPESHLHPSAQSVITNFLALIALRGVQVFIETHSEHILNALRVMVRQEDIDCNDICIMYFGDYQEQIYKNLNVNEEGKVSEWPRGFFDQSENDLNILLGL